MVETMDKIVGVLYKIIRVALCVILLAMIGILMAHIISRYILNSSLTWSEELLKILLVWFGMMSVSVLAARREHVSIVIFKEHMPKKSGRYFDKSNSDSYGCYLYCCNLCRNEVCASGRTSSYTGTETSLQICLRSNPGFLLFCNDF